MKSAMTYDIGSANVINMLTLWNTSEMWEDKTLFAEIQEVIQKLSRSSYQLSERELFITQELTNGLLEATLASFANADYLLKEDLTLALNDIANFQSFLVTASDVH